MAKPLSAADTRTLRRDGFTVLRSAAPRARVDAALRVINRALLRLETSSRYTLGVGVLLSDVPRPRMGNLMVYPGTHERLASLVSRGGLEALAAPLPRLLGETNTEQVTGKAGDAVLFHYQLAHDTMSNDSPAIRYMAYFRIYHADAWRDRSPEYARRAVADPWLEWTGLGGRP